jgi:hypothetical protein
MIMISEQPLDMTKPEHPAEPPPTVAVLVAAQETSPPPLTRIISSSVAGGKIKTTPSSPKDFFAKLYGPATEEKKPAVTQPLLPPRSSPSTAGLPPRTGGGDVTQHIPLVSPGEQFRPGLLHHPCLPVNGGTFLAGGGGPHHSLGYPPDAAALFRLDTLPFPGGLAAFCKYLF